MRSQKKRCGNQIRHDSYHECFRLEIRNTQTNKTEKGPYVIAAESGWEDVRREMNRILTEEHGSLQRVSSHRIIILHIQSPDVPQLDLVDMPGLVTVPEDMHKQTTELVKSHLNQYSSNSLYLAIVKSTVSPNLSNALKLLQDANVFSKTFGVFTFCDDMGKRTVHQLRDCANRKKVRCIML